MLIACILLGVGLVMIFLEFFLPGGIMAMLGAALVVISLFVYSVTDHSLASISLFVVGAIALVALVMKVALWQVKSNGNFYLEDVQEGFSASSFAQELIGKEGVAFSDLRPSGYIQVNDQQYQAVAKCGYIPKGCMIEVIAGEGAHLVIQKKEEK